MAVTYTQTLSADVVVSEIESLLDWYGHALRQGFFPAEKTAMDAVQQPPAHLLDWCRQESEGGQVDKAVAARLEMAHADLAAAGARFLEHCSGGVAPTAAVYDAFEHAFEGYVTHIRRLQQDASGAAVAVDPVTGLRTVSGLQGELRREQDRFDRKHTPFSVANIEIDNIAALQAAHNPRTLQGVYAAVAKSVARILRSFDDAYFLGKGEYLLVLKHVEFMDACSVMDRLRQEIENLTITLPSGDYLRVTASFGVAEAVEKEDPARIMDHAKTARLEAQNLGGNRVEEFREVSALGRLAKNLND